MAVVAFVRPEPEPPSTALGPGGRAEPDEVDGKLRFYGRSMKFCFIFILTSWVSLQVGCLLSLFLHFRSGIVVGTIDGSLAFKFWQPIDYFAPTHALAREFILKAFPEDVSAAYSLILTAAAVPFCASLALLAQLFSLYSRGEVFTRRTATVMRRIGHSIMATGYSPFLLGPVAHLRDRLKMVVAARAGVIQALDVDTREPWPNGRDCPQDEAVSERPDGGGVAADPATSA